MFGTLPKKFEVFEGSSMQTCWRHLSKHFFRVGTCGAFEDQRNSFIWETWWYIYTQQLIYMSLLMCCCMKSPEIKKKLLPETFACVKTTTWSQHSSVRLSRLVSKTLVPNCYYFPLSQARAEQGTTGLKVFTQMDVTFWKRSWTRLEKKPRHVTRSRASRLRIPWEAVRGLGSVL